jgi:hypothetical protein
MSPRGLDPIIPIPNFAAFQDRRPGESRDPSVCRVGGSGVDTGLRRYDENGRSDPRFDCGGKDVGAWINSGHGDIGDC